MELVLFLFGIVDLLAGSIDGEVIHRPPRGRTTKISQGLTERAAKLASARIGALLGIHQFRVERVLNVFIHFRAQFLPDVAVVVLRLPDVLRRPFILLVHRGDAEITWHFIQE